MTRPQKMFAEALIVVGLLGATWVAVERVMVEQTNTAVGMSVDWGEVEQLAASSGISATDMLVSLQSGGATHLAISERSLSELAGSGEIALFRSGDRVDILAGDANLIGQVAQALQSRFPGDYERRETPEGDLWLNAPARAVSNTAAGAGYPRAAIEAAGRAGLRVVVRPVAAGVRTPAAVEGVIRQAAVTGAEVVVFSGDSIVGFPGMVETTAQAMRAHDLTFGMIEMSPQRGAAELSTRLDHDVIRVHSITGEEMAVLSVGRAVERFVRASRERGARLLYLRMLPSASEGLVEGNALYLSRVREGLRGLGFTVGPPSPAEPLSTPPWRLAVVTLGVCGALLWLMQVLFGFPGRWFWAAAVLLVGAGCGGMIVAAGPLRLVAALAASILFPVMAVGWSARGLAAGATGRPGLASALGRLLGAFLAVSVVTAFGGLLVVGLLGDSAYLVKVAQFRGVKIAHMLPILAVALVWLARSMDAYRERMKDAGPDMVDYHTGDTVPEWPALWAGLRQALTGVIVYWHVAAAALALGLLGMLVMRSGNEATGAILPLEMEMRSALDRILGVRPRTKEVFIGHPILLLAILLAIRRVRKGVWILFAVGVIGQVSLLNSFCHVHTPLMLTVLRVFNGLWVGALGGVVLCALWDFFGGAPEPEPEPPPQASLELDEDSDEV
ncbi:MAG: DUF5693 family protein [Armatimonadota bacterium]|jgi:hypothetical protein